jgi:Domain of unknown function (DUF4136)
MKIQTHFFLSLIFLLLGCDSTKIMFDYDKSTDFTGYQSFKFLPWSPENSKRVNELDRDRLYMAIKAELEARQIMETEKEPNLFVNLLVILEQKTGVNAYSDYYSPYGYNRGFGYGYGGYGGYGGSSTTYSEYQYTDGTIVIDIFDASEKKLIWQGSAIGEVRENQKTYEKEADIRNLVRDMFAYYPIKKVKK